MTKKQTETQANLMAITKKERELKKKRQEEDYRKYFEQEWKLISTPITIIDKDGWLPGLQEHIAANGYMDQTVALRLHEENEARKLKQSQSEQNH